MKNLKVKSILFSLLAVMAVAIFMTSCGQEEIITNEIESNSTELTERLADNTNFQEIIKLLSQGQMDENFTELISGYTTALGIEMPELIELDRATFEELMIVSSADVNHTNIAPRCEDGDAYYGCAYGAYLTYFYAWYECPTDGSDFGNCYATLTASLEKAYEACFDLFCE